MNSNTIIELISEALEAEIKNESIKLDSVPEYDSMGILMIMEIFELHEVDLFPEDFKSLVTIADLVDTIKSKQC